MRYQLSALVQKKIFKYPHTSHLIKNLTYIYFNSLYRITDKPVARCIHFPPSYLPCLPSTYTTKFSSTGLMIQYSFTPASSYNSNFKRTSFFEFPGESISTTRSGAPQQPRSSIFDTSHMTHKSGCITVVISLSFFCF